MLFPSEEADFSSCVRWRDLQRHARCLHPTSIPPSESTGRLAMLKSAVEPVPLFKESRAPLRIALVDDHPLFREGLRAILMPVRGFEIVGEAGEARDAYALVEQLQPDVVVIDVALPGQNGIVATRELLRRDPRLRILILSMHLEEDYVAQALAAGALGYALKDQSSESVMEAIRVVARDQTYLSPRISRFVVEDALRLRRGAD